jgi:hypothetical protein
LLIVQGWWVNRLLAAPLTPAAERNDQRPCPGHLNTLDRASPSLGDACGAVCFEEEAENCRRKAVAYVGQPEAPFLISVARQLDRLMSGRMVPVDTGPEVILSDRIPLETKVSPLALKRRRPAVPPTTSPLKLPPVGREPLEIELIQSGFRRVSNSFKMDVEERLPRGRLYGRRN